MLAKAKGVLSRLPVIGYGLHWLVDLCTLPLIRLDLIHEIRYLREARQRDHEALLSQVASLRQSFDEALTQLDLLYNRIVPLSDSEGTGESLSQSEARAEMLLRFWIVERRLTEMERRAR